MAFEDGKMLAITSSNSYVRTGPGTSNPYIGRFYKNNMFLCAGTTGNWVKVHWGNRDKREFAYISMDNVREDSCNTSNVIVPIMNMALSFAQFGSDVSGKEIESAGLELGGEWCQTFLYWLCNAAGLYGSANLPPFGDALCSEAVSFFTSRGQYYDANGFQPRLGDWIYYKRIGSNDIASHVGIVNDFYNNKIYTVEGNWGSPRCVRVFNDAAAEHSGYTIVGYARPT